MKVLYATSEALPFAISGGLGEVAGSLPQALRKRLIGCRVVMPLYGTVDPKLKETMKFITHISVPVAWRRQYCGIFEARAGGVIYYLIDNQYYFKRDALYGHYDDAERFAFFSRAVLEIIPIIDFKPDIIHCNDWQTALTPFYYTTMYAKRDGYENIKTILTIHNIQYQGSYGKEIVDNVIGADSEHMSLLEYDGGINLMKAGIECANIVSTVSPTYAKEILDPWYSHGLDTILKERSWKIKGILNGIDTESYNPETDSDIYEFYSADDLSKKAVNKKKLQERLSLPQKEETPVIGMVTRLVSHKGLDLVKEILDDFLLQNDVQVVVLGSGEWQYENFFKEILERYPEKFSLTLGFVPELARKIYAGSDIFLMPSKSEPCGLSQMVALRYGTIPIVRETGGLKDSVTDSGDGKGNGFVFSSYNSDDLHGTLKRACEGYSNKEGWEILVKRAMKCDNSWGKSAREYMRLYRDILKS